MSQHFVPESLADAGLAPVWDAVRQRLDRSGDATRGTIRMPLIEQRCVPALAALIGHPPTARLDLAELEAGLVRLGVGGDLGAAVELLGFRPDPGQRRRSDAREKVHQARAAMASELKGWPEAWADGWGDGLFRSGLLNGLDADAVASLLGDVRRFVDARNDAAGRAASRTELAARLFGSAHALDRQTKLAAAVERVLRCVIGAGGEELEGRALWDAAGIAVDSVSAPVLTWGLRPLAASPLASMIAAASEARLPVHVSLRALRAHRVEAAAGTPVLVVENPSVVEHAADASAAFGLVCTNGNPTAAVTELVDQLASSGADLHYHGDFDSAGIAICRRMERRGCRPWMMSADDYLGAVHLAEARGVELPRGGSHAGPTPWDPALEAAFDECRCIVHEELVAADLLREFGARFGN